MSERTPRTWGENVWPTAQQLADWLAVCTPTERVTHATIAMQDAQRADVCLVKNHDALAARLADVEARAEAAEAKVARVEALADRWAKEAVERGPFDEIYTDGVAAMLHQALRGDQ